MMKRDVPVYLITGFLESGKTQFLDFTIIFRFRTKRF